VLEELRRTARRDRARDDVGTPWGRPRPVRVGFPIAGCLFRLVGLGFLLIVLFILFLVVLFGGLVI
jgi:hypothetical protein